MEDVVAPFAHCMTIMALKAFLQCTDRFSQFYYLSAACGKFSCCSLTLSSIYYRMTHNLQTREFADKKDIENFSIHSVHVFGAIQNTKQCEAKALSVRSTVSERNMYFLCNSVKCL